MQHVYVIMLCYVVCIYATTILYPWWVSSHVHMLMGSLWWPALSSHVHMLMGALWWPALSSHVHILMGALWWPALSSHVHMLMGALWWPALADCREEQYPCTRLYSVHQPCKQCLNSLCFYRLGHNLWFLLVDFDSKSVQIVWMYEVFNF